MSVIEDTRKVLQDLAPELREFSARVSSLEERMDARFDTLEKQTDTRFEGSERLASERHARIMEAISKLADFHELRERVARIEAQQRPS